MTKKPVVLCILDGWGVAPKSKYNAISVAKTPVYDSLLTQYPNSKLGASGNDVGLPKGQMGNSKVGHMNIGCGRIIMQELVKIDNAIVNNTLKDVANLNKLIDKLKKNGGVCHLFGLLSDGGVHSHIDHIIALAKIVSSAGVKVKLHAALDGRDVAQKSAIQFIKQVQDAGIEIATVSGRYYAMDRDNRWERTEDAYNVMINGIYKVDDIAKHIEDCYAEGITDEFVESFSSSDYDGIHDGDAFLIANFRADRVRQLAEVIGNEESAGLDRIRVVKLSAKLGMTSYSEEISKYFDVIFPDDEFRNSLGEVLANNGKTQLRIAETEKYAHVTYFFSGGQEVEFEGESRILIPSPKVATYDLKPEMCAEEVTKIVVDAIENDKFDFIVINYANPDLVGHTGVVEASVKACEAIDKQVGILKDAVLAKDGVLLVTADHGNIEQMWDEENNLPNTKHTTNPVPFIYVANDMKAVENGRLCDIAPTVLKIMGIDKSKEMNGISLIK